MASNQTSLFDITRRKSHGSGLSDEANLQVPKKSVDRMLVLAFIKEERRGRTLHELCCLMQKSPNQISGRISELIADNKIHRVVESVNPETGKVKHERREFHHHQGSVYKVSQ